MSFSVYLSSAEGTPVAGSVNQLTYNFGFDKTPEHKGGYKVYMTFMTSIFNLNPFIQTFNDIYVNANLGRCDSYTAVGLYTGTKNNQVLGVATMMNNEFTVIQVNKTVGAVPIVGTATIPNNAGTTGYTETENVTTPSNTYNFIPRNDNCGCFNSDNRPIFLATKPTNNLFTITLTNGDGTLHTQFSSLTSPFYGIILTFEAV